MGPARGTGRRPDFSLFGAAAHWGPGAAGVSTWRAIWAMARVRLWLWILSGFLASGVMYAFPLVPGLVVRQFIDTLSNGATFGPNLWTPLALLVAVAVAPTLTRAVLAPVVVVIILVRIANARIITFRQAAQQSIGNVTGLLGDVFSAALAIKVADAEERIVAHLRKLNESRRRAQLADRVFTAFVSAASTNVANLGTAVLLLLAAKSMSEGRFTVGDFALFVSYIAWLTAIISQFGIFMGNF